MAKTSAILLVLFSVRVGWANVQHIPECAGEACDEVSLLQKALQKEELPSDEQTFNQTADRIVDVVFDDTIIPADGKSFCVYHALPTDDTYQAVRFAWTPSTSASMYNAEMFSISDRAVENLKAAGYNIRDSGSSVMDCSGTEAFMISQWSGGHLFMQQAPVADYPQDPIPSDWGMPIGKNTARKHVLVKWEFSGCTSGHDCQDQGHGFHIHLLRGTPRPINFGTAKFATATSNPFSLSMSLPQGQKAWRLISQCTTQGTKDLFRDSGVEILRAHAFGGWLHAFRLLESVGGGNFSESTDLVTAQESCRFPHYTNQLLEDGDFQEVWKSDWVRNFVQPPTTVRITPGNSYRLECIYDTTLATEDITGGTDVLDANCELHFYYREIPGENEPYPGVCMDVGPWFMRSPQLPASEAQKDWQLYQSHERLQQINQMMNGCPGMGATYAP